MNAPELRVNRMSGSALIRDYITGAPALSRFYPGSPFDIEAYRRVADEVRRCFREDNRRAMADAITSTTEDARARLDAIAAGDGFFVSTGQQAGLFSGPIFTIYKTLTTVRLAQELEARLGVPVAPLFWIAADDHDFAEVNHTFAIGNDGELHRLEIGGTGETQHSMNLQPLDDSATAMIEQLAGLLPQSEFTDEVLGWVRDAYVPGFSVAAAFQQLLERMFARYDILITSSAHPVVKSLAAPVILRELETSEQHERAIRAQTDRLIAAGYHEQVTVRAGAANVLYEDEAGRDRLTREGDHWALARSKRRFSTSEIRDQLALQPERFSPNVLLRPVVASEVFPTLAYVGGPAEVSYFGQIGCLFAAHGVTMPLVVPRASMDVVEYKVQKVLDKFHLGVDDVRQPFDQLTSQVMRDELPEDVTATVAGLRDQIAECYGKLVDATQSIDPTLKSPVENARNSSQKTLADIEKKIVSHLKKKNEVGVEQLKKASLNLYPNGEPQERVINALTYLARYGTEFMDAVLRKIETPLDSAASDWSGVQC